MHMRNGALCVCMRGIEDVCDTAIRHELFVCGHLKFRDIAIGTEDLAQMIFVDILGQFFDDNLGAARYISRSAAGARL